MHKDARESGLVAISRRAERHVRAGPTDPAIGDADDCLDTRASMSTLLARLAASRSHNEIVKQLVRPYKAFSGNSSDGA